MRNFAGVAIFLAIGLVAGAAGAPDKPCNLIRYVSLPVTLDPASRPMVPLMIDGQVENLLVDTGGVFSELGEGVVAKLNLPPKPMDFYLEGFGGRIDNQYVTVPAMQIAGQTVKDRPFVVTSDDSLPLGVDGILGPDILAVFDVDFDFAAGKITLFSPDHCEGKVVYWSSGNYAMIPFRLDDWRHVLVNTTLDGKNVRATIDTGSYRSVMSLEFAADLFDLDKAELKKETGRHPFKTLAFEGVTVNSPDIMLVPDRESRIMGGYGEPKLILGMGVLRQLHLYIAYKERNLYITAAGAH